jgi:hypothetical protein
MLQRRWFVLGSIALLAGCGGGKGLTAKVSGKVTLDNQPLTKGDVTFSPTTPDGQIAYGTIDSSGNYTLKTGGDTGIKPGEYEVSVRATGEPPASDKPPPLLTPEKYADPKKSGWKFTVKAGSNTFDLPMVSEVTPPQ